MFDNLFVKCNIKNIFLRHSYEIICYICNSKYCIAFAIDLGKENDQFLDHSNNKLMSTLCVDFSYLWSGAWSYLFPT